PGRCHCRAPQVRISGDSQARALQARSAFPGSTPTPMIPVQRRMGWRLHSLQAVGRAKIRTQNAPSTKRSSFLTLRLPVFGTHNVMARFAPDGLKKVKIQVKG